MVPFLFLLFCFNALSEGFVKGSAYGTPEVRNPGRDISLPILIRKEMETRKLERKSKQQISRVNDIISR